MDVRGLTPFRAWCAMAAVPLLLAGCDAIPGLFGGLPGTGATAASAEGGIQSGGDVPPSREVVDEAAEVNNDFNAAQPATLAYGGTITINGTIETNGDLDLYALGPMQAGERITIDVVGHNGLNTTAALFDASGSLIDANDDRSFYGGRLDPYIHRQLREGSDNLYLGVGVSGASLFASTAGRFDSGSYQVQIRHEPAAAVRAARTQVVLLDFLGGRLVQIGLEPVETMNPLKAEAISPRLVGMTDYIIDLLTQHMARDFAAYDVVLLDSRFNSPPETQHSALYFGNFSNRFLGLADNVDTGNASLQQEAIIYAETLALFENLRPSAEEIAQALANIGSHELGHLLGLEHTREPADLMSTASTARQVLEQDASFTRALVHFGVFPVGWQDGPATLLSNVGPSRQPAARARAFDLASPLDRAFRDLIDPSEIANVPMCGRCAS